MGHKHEVRLSIGRREPSDIRHCQRFRDHIGHESYDGELLLSSHLHARLISRLLLNIFPLFSLSQRQINVKSEFDIIKLTNWKLKIVNVSVFRLSVLQRSAICTIYPQCKICKLTNGFFEGTRKTQKFSSGPLVFIYSSSELKIESTSLSTLSCHKVATLTHSPQRAPHNLHTLTFRKLYFHQQCSASRKK